MGCVLSNFDEDERVGICKERKRLIKQLVGVRGEFSDSLLAYLKALRNTGSTLRQLTESDSLEFETASNGPPSSPPYLPSSPLRPPPPLPAFIADKAAEEVAQEKSLENYDNNVPTMQSDPSMDPYWIFPPIDQNYEIVESVEEENWEETKTEFEDEDPEAEAGVSVVKSRSGKQPIDDSSSAMSLCRKDTTVIPMVVSRREKTLEGIVKEIDDYFLKASACVKEIAVLIDISQGDTLLRQNSGHHNRKSGNSAKVFSVLSWRYSKSPQFTKDAAEFSGPREPCKPGAHCATLKKLYAAEKKLFKAVKEEGIAKLEFERKSLLLQKQEDENHEWVKIEKTKSSVEDLESDIISLRQSISETTASILELIDEELLPQLDALTAGLKQMWTTMHECHKAQLLITEQLRNVSDNQKTILDSEHHHQATIQFETEATYWYTSFCKLVKSQREYVKTLCKWIQHTNFLRDGHECSDQSTMIRTICDQWEQGLDQLPDIDKEASDAIKSLLSSIRCIVAQQAQEDYNLRKLQKLERKLHKCLNSLAEMEQKVNWSFENDGDVPVNMSPMHPLSLKRTKTEALRKQVESMKAKYLDSVQCGNAMTLNNLKTRLPHLFKSLSEFSRASAQAVEGVPIKPVERTDIVASQN